MKAIIPGAVVFALAVVFVLAAAAAGLQGNKSAEEVFLGSEHGVDQDLFIGRSVEDFISAGGRFDLEALRESGYQGPLDLDGHDVRLNPRSGEPRIRELAPGGAMDHPDDVYWREGQGVPGVDGTVSALVV